ncbi:hypothetical protein VTN96DRAFT_5389 [Rasamsonia emersonii]|uniref:Alpha/beta hydrolase fold family protein n=1 Tax=Rasamsonia emersonii (strain ATCC 16479 / CBS 393.64 / IMI 116815) TaxID=1408163 RepID=A0A0F4YV67_RASE3|nr:Alpha/beta hydrolase fold family protein [Rasamsonia emersonii CBS 393.64]KKA22162.1 Alpha/beta hydrolase fold family protein [Rasamsonia emersonii CBS 393.64]
MTFTYIIHENKNNDQNQTQRKPLLVIQCPGWGIGARYLREGLSPLLEEHYTLLYFIPRGTAGSSRPPGGESDMGTWAMADDLELLRRHLKIAKFPALLGHSNGGAIALAYAEKFPDSVDRLVLLCHRLVGLTPDTSLMQRSKDDARYRAAFVKKQAKSKSQAKTTAETESDEQATQYWKDILPLYFFDPDSGVPQLLRAMGKDLVSAWCQHAQGTCDAEQLYRPTRPMVQKLKDVRAKTLIIAGKYDMICAVDNGQQTQRGIPHGAELKVYDRCGHFPWIERPEKTEEDIVGFLSS